MAIDSELNIVLTASEQLGKDGKTSIKCPRCGDGLEMTSDGTSYTVKCKTDGCIVEEFRGI